jgi:diguanylate cyclase (GGDEF)-like protein
MSSIPIAALVGFIGILSELGGALLLVALFALLREQAARRPYFRLWGWAWVSVSVAIAALAARYTALVTPGAVPPDEFHPGVRASYFIYQFCKLSYYGLLVLGTWVHARGIRALPVLKRGLPAVAAYAALTVGVSPSLSAVVLWQAPLAVAGYGACAALLFRLPPSRRGLGSTATGTFFSFLAGLWVLYLLAFGMAESLYVSSLGPVLGFVLRYNSYLDMLLHMLLGYGMVLVLMEERKREVDDAHAELAVAHDQLRRVALYDVLTGTFNRRAWAEGVGLEVAKATFGAAVMLDVDNLKAVNDTYGHPAGDELLQRVAEALRSTLRASDKLYRWGGDEFLLVLPGANAAEVRARLDAALRLAPALEVSRDKPRVPIQVSVGAADYAGAEALEGAIERADQAMYQEKARRKLGRGFTPNLKLEA